MPENVSFHLLTMLLILCTSKEDIESSSEILMVRAEPTCDLEKESNFIS